MSLGSHIIHFINLHNITQYQPTSICQSCSVILNYTLACWWADDLNGTGVPYALIGDSFPCGGVPPAAAAQQFNCLLSTVVYTTSFLVRMADQMLVSPGESLAVATRLLYSFTVSAQRPGHGMGPPPFPSKCWLRVSHGYDSWIITHGISMDKLDKQSMICQKFLHSMHRTRTKLCLETRRQDFHHQGGPNAQQFKNFGASTIGATSPKPRRK